MSAVGRIFNVVLGFWFVFLVAEPIPAHDCPMHSPAGYANPESNGEHDAPAEVAGKGNAGHSMDKEAPPSPSNEDGTHEGHKSDSSHSPTDKTDGHSGHFCLCLGCAAGSQSVKSAPPSSGIPIPAHLYSIEPTEPQPPHMAAVPDFILPPSTAPPSKMS